MYSDGADVVFHAAGGSGVGVFEAARELSGSGRQLWAIGVDTDQFETVRTLTGVVDAEGWRAHILTSVLKRMDVAVYTVVAEFAHGEFRPGPRIFDLATDGVGLSTSGGYLAEIQPKIDEFKAKIIAGTIDVPCVPPDKVAEARAFGFSGTDCPN
jgi:basic membrane protein A